MMPRITKPFNLAGLGLVDPLLHRRHSYRRLTRIRAERARADPYVPGTGRLGRS